MAKQRVDLLYEAASQEYDLGTRDEFVSKLQDPNKRKALYDAIGEQYQLGTFDEFSSKVVEKKNTNTPTVSSGMGVSLAGKGSSRSVLGNYGISTKPTQKEPIKGVPVSIANPTLQKESNVATKEKFSNFNDLNKQVVDTVARVEGNRAKDIASMTGGAKGLLEKANDVIVETITSGTASVLSGIAGLVGSAADLAINKTPQKKAIFLSNEWFQSKIPIIQQGEVADPAWWSNQGIRDKMMSLSENLSKISTSELGVAKTEIGLENSSKSSIDYIIEGDYKNGAKSALVDIGQQIPQLVAMAMSGGSTATLGVMGLSSAGGNMADQFKDDGDISVLDFAQGASVGIAEALSEKVFNLDIKALGRVGGKVFDFLGDSGKALQKQIQDEGVDIVKDKLIRSFGGALKEAGMGAGQEILEENIVSTVDYLTKALDEDVLNKKGFEEFTKELGQNMIVAGPTGGGASLLAATASLKPLTKEEKVKIGQYQQVLNNENSSKEVKQIAKQRIDAINNGSNTESEALYDQVMTLPIEDRVQVIDKLNTVKKIEAEAETLPLELKEDAARTVAQLREQINFALNPKEAEIQGSQIDINPITKNNGTYEYNGETYTIINDGISDSNGRMKPLSLIQEVVDNGKKIDTTIIPENIVTPETETTQEVVPDVSISDIIDKRVTMGNKNGNLYQEENGLVVFIEDGGRKIEIGNINDISRSPISDFKIDTQETVVGSDENGNITVRGESYINPYSSPTAAINYDSKGNIVSVNMETSNGSKRAFRGNIAEDVAYQIHLKEISKDNERLNSFEEYINSEQGQQEINNGQIQGVAKTSTEQSDAVIPEPEVTPVQPTSETTKPVALQDADAKEDKDKVEQVSNATKTSPKNIRDLYKVNRNLFGLDRVKAFASAVVMDRMIGAMAKRAVIPKTEMYGRLKFDKANEKDLPQGVKMQIDAWHGSPYEFDKFSTEFIGKGEGAQSFGWGLYFTDLKGIAESYAKKLANARAVQYEGKTKYELVGKHPMVKMFLMDLEQSNPKSKQDALLWLEKNKKGKSERVINELTELIDNITIDKNQSKNLYKVSLHQGKTPAQYTWLEWDKPVSRSTVKKFIEELNKDSDFKKNYGNSYLRELENGQYDNLIGENFYNGLAKSAMQKLGKSLAKDVSLALLNANIDGIKYPSESIARGNNSDNARGFNYVVFDETAVSVEEVIKFQKDANKARGAAMVSMDGQAVIYALTDPNVSTPLHELAHVFEHYLTDAEKTAVMKSAGTKSWDTKTSEYFARGFEKYLSEGNSPITALDKIFAKFKEWLTDIYNGIKGSDIDIKLNKEMREIYASMLGTSPEQAADASAKMYQDSEQAILAAGKKNWWSLFKKFTGNRKTDIERVITATEKGRFANAAVENVSGSMSYADEQFMDARKRLYTDFMMKVDKRLGKLSVSINKAITDIGYEKKQALDEVIFHRRVINIDSNYDKKNAKLDKEIAALEAKRQATAGTLAKTKVTEEIKKLKGQREPRIKHPRGFNKEVSSDALDGIKQRVGKEEFDDIMKRADIYFEIRAEITDKMVESGLISKDTAYNLLGDEYVERRFLEYILEDGKRPGQPSALSSAQIKALSEGSEGLVLMDSEVLLHAAYRAIENRVAQNRANKALAEAVTEQKFDKSVVITAEFAKNLNGKPKMDKYGQRVLVAAPNGFTLIPFYENGEKSGVFMRNEEANQWNDTVKLQLVIGDINIDSALKKASGTSILKFFATLANPLFAVGNVARDFQKVVFLSSTYDTNILTAAPRLLLNFSNKVAQYTALKTSGVATDEFRKLVDDYTKYGGKFEFLHRDGKSNNLYKNTLNRKKYQIQRIGGAAYNLFENSMGLPGEISEISMRLAVFEKTRDTLIKNAGGKSAVSDKTMADINLVAANASRAIMDYNKGGLLTKWLDNFSPYLNASVVGFVSDVNYIKKNPKQFAAKMAIFGTNVAAITLYNLMNSDDEDRKNIPDYIKNNNFIFFIPGKNKDGKKEYRLIPKYQGLQQFAAMFEEATEAMYRMYTGKEQKKIGEPADRLLETISTWSPIPMTLRGLMLKLPPAAQAAYAYSSNYDLFRNSTIEYRKDKVPTREEGLDNDKTARIYRVLGNISSKLGEDFTISPSRAQNFTEKFITSPTTNFIVGNIYGIADWITQEHQIPREIKEAKPSTVKASVKNKFVREVDPEYLSKFKAKKNTIEKEITAESEFQQKTIKLMVANGESNDKIVEFIKGLEVSPEVKVTRLKKAADLIATKNDAKTVPYYGELMDVKYIDGLRFPTPEDKAAKAFDRFGGVDPKSDDFIEILSSAKKLKVLTKGDTEERFLKEYSRLFQKSQPEGKQK